MVTYRLDGLWPSNNLHRLLLVLVLLVYAHLLLCLSLRQETVQTLRWLTP